MLNRVWKVTSNVLLFIDSLIKKVLFPYGIPKHIIEYEACLHRIDRRSLYLLSGYEGEDTKVQRPQTCS